MKNWPQTINSRSLRNFILLLLERIASIAPVKFLVRVVTPRRFRWFIIRRLSTIQMDRLQLIRSLVDREGKGVEIGPAYNPAFPKTEFDVDTVDYVSAAGLRAKYDELHVDTSRIEEVDYIWQGEPLSELIPVRNYAFIFAGHVIEHVPDIVDFLENCAALLKPNGALVLAIPDKRYCFDAFSALSSTGDILDAHRTKRKRHTPGAHFDFVAYEACKQGGSRTWSPTEPGPPVLMNSVEKAVRVFREHDDARYIDIHAWRFTPSSFRLIVSDLHKAGFIRFRETAFYDTAGCEFFVRLGLNGPGCRVPRNELCMRTVSELAEAAANYR